MIGGGDTAMEEALFLTRFATQVTIIHRREQFRASKMMLERARNNPKIRFLTSTVVDEVYDVQKHEVTGLKLRNVCTGDTYVFPVSAMFLGIGHIPNTGAFVGQLRWMTTATLKPMITCSPISLEFSPAVTHKTAVIGKQSQRPVRGVWPLSKWKSSWKNMDGSRWRTENCCVVSHLGLFVDA